MGNYNYDRRTAEQVWKRVQQASAAARETAEMELAKSCLPDKDELEDHTSVAQVPEWELVQWCAWVLAMGESYFAMGRQRREYAQTFCRLAREAREDGWRFQTLRYLLYGQGAPIKRGAVEGTRRFGAALRSCYGQEVNMRREFLLAAERWRDQAELLETMAVHAGARINLLEAVARRTMQNPAN